MTKICPCCRLDLVWVDNGRTLQYWYCRECKKEEAELNPPVLENPCKEIEITSEMPRKRRPTSPALEAAIKAVDEAVKKNLEKQALKAFGIGYKLGSDEKIVPWKNGFGIVDKDGRSLFVDTVGARFSSSQPQVQQIPRSFDYGELELRVMAAQSGRFQSQEPNQANGPKLEINREAFHTDLDPCNWELGQTVRLWGTAFVVDRKELRCESGKPVEVMLTICSTEHTKPEAAITVEFNARNPDEAMYSIFNKVRVGREYGHYYRCPRVERDVNYIDESAPEYRLTIYANPDEYGAYSVWPPEADRDLLYKLPQTGREISFQLARLMPVSWNVIHDETCVEIKTETITFDRKRHGYRDAKGDAVSTKQWYQVDRKRRS